MRKLIHKTKLTINRQNNQEKTKTNHDKSDNTINIPVTYKGRVKQTRTDKNSQKFQ